MLKATFDGFLLEQNNKYPDAEKNMLKIEIPETDRKLLPEARCNYPHPRVMRGMDAPYLKSFGLKNTMICDMPCISENTLRAYFSAAIDIGSGD